MRRSIPLALLVVALAPTGASAAVRCVDQVAPDCESTVYDTINAAVTAATPGDTIRIAAGTYPETVGTDKPLTFEGASSGTLESDVGATVIAPPTSVAMILPFATTLRSLRVEGGGSNGSAAMMLQPDTAEPQSYLLEHVVAIGAAAGLATGGDGVVAGPVGPAQTMSLEVVDSELQSGAAAFGAIGLRATGATDTTVTDSLIAAPLVPLGGTAVALTGGSGTITDSVLQGGVAAQFVDGAYSVVRSWLAGHIAGAYVTSSPPGQPMTEVSISDSLVTAFPDETSSPGAAALEAYLGPSASPIDVDVRGSTVVAEGPSFLGAVYAANAGGGTAAVEIDLQNSVSLLEDPDTGQVDLMADGGTITAASSSFTTAGATNGGQVPPPGSNGSVSGNPMLDSSLAPLAGSPLIDRGSLAFVTPGELDFAGLPRVVDGDCDDVARPDIGAFERPSAPCPPPSAPGGDRPPPPANVSPAISGVSLLRKTFTTRKPIRKGRKRGTTLRFTLSEAARVALRIDRKTTGRRVTVRGKRRCLNRTRQNAERPRCQRLLEQGTLRMNGEGGRNELRISGNVGGRALPPGAYRATLVAVDSGGLRSSAKPVTFRVLRP